MKPNLKLLLVFIGIAILIPTISFAASYFYVGDNGYLGIGTASPLAPLDIVGSIYSRLFTIADESSTTIDWSKGNVQEITLDNSNTNLTFSNGEAGGEYKLIINQDTAGDRTITWPKSVEWAGGAAPELTTVASGTDVATFIDNGANYLGTYSLNYYSIPVNGITFDNATSTTQTTQNPNLSYIVSGTDTLLIVSLFENSGFDDVSGVTYNGSSLIQEKKVRISSGNYCYEYVLLGTPTGSNTLSISRTSSGSGQSLGIAVASYDGVKQSGFPDGSHSVTGTSVGIISDNVTTSVNNAWAMTGYCSANSGTTSAGSGTTERTNGMEASVILDTNKAVPVGSATLNVNNSSKSVDRWGLMTLSFDPAL